MDELLGMGYPVQMKVDLLASISDPGGDITKTQTTNFLLSAGMSVWLVKFCAAVLPAGAPSA